MTLISTLTLLSGINSISVDVIQHHLKGFWGSITELYFQERKVFEWHLSCPKQLHKTHDIHYKYLNFSYTAHCLFNDTVYNTEYTASNGMMIT